MRLNPMAHRRQAKEAWMSDRLGARRSRVLLAVLGLAAVAAFAVVGTAGAKSASELSAFLVMKQPSFDDLVGASDDRCRNTQPM